MMSIHSIQITEITIFPVRNRQPGAPLQAFARIVLNDAFVVTGLRLVQGKFGMFVAFPREKGKDITICFPIRKDLQEEMSRVILDEYNLNISGSNCKVEVKMS
jgi:DNA-binding cell septation regulator SpoVG